MEETKPVARRTVSKPAAKTTGATKTRSLARPKAAAKPVTKKLARKPELDLRPDKIELARVRSRARGP